MFGFLSVAILIFLLLSTSYQPSWDQLSTNNICFTVTEQWKISRLSIADKMTGPGEGGCGVFWGRTIWPTSLTRIGVWLLNALISTKRIQSSPLTLFGTNSRSYPSFAPGATSALYLVSFGCRYWLPTRGRYQVPNTGVICWLILTTLSRGQPVVSTLLCMPYSNNSIIAVDEQIFPVWVPV